MRQFVLAAAFVCFAAVARAAEPEPQSLFDGETISGWKLADTNGYLNPGKVEVRDGAILMAKGTVSTGIVYGKDDFPKMNYEISVEARRTDGSDFFSAMTFPVNDSHCTLVVGGWGGGTTGLSNVNGFSADENETTGFTEFENGRWYTIRLRVTEARIEAWIDKKQIVDLETKDKTFKIWWEQEPLRPFGIGNWHSASELRNIKLTRLEADAKREPQAQKESTP